MSCVPYYSFVSLRSLEVPDKPGTRGLHGHCPGLTGGAGYRPPSPGSPQSLPPDFQGVLEALGLGPESYGRLLRACRGASVRLASFVLECSLRAGDVLGPTSSSVPPLTARVRMLLRTGWNEQRSRTFNDHLMFYRFSEG